MVRRYLPVRTPRPSGRPREHADPERDGRGDHLALDPALQQRVLGLDRGEADLALEQARRTGHLPAGVVGQPDVAGAPAGDGEPQRGHRLVERGARVGRLDEPQVDVVGLQAPQGAVQRRQEPAARGVDHAAVAGAPDAGLRAQDDLVARDDVAEQLTEELLGATVGVGGGRVHERAAGVREVPQLLGRVVRVRVAAPGHRAEPEPGDPQTRAAQVALFHEAQH